MEFQDVVRRRRMVRRYTREPVTPAQVERMLANAVRAPSAGFSQGWSFLVLDSAEDVARYWQIFRSPAAEGAAGKPDRWLRGMMTAPVLIIPCSSKSAYLSRYAESDKGWTDGDEARWSVPYWHMDTAMATMLILQTAVDEGLGACYFGIPPARLAAVKETFGIPDGWDPIGVVSVGHPDLSGEAARGSASRRTRRTHAEVAHRGHW